MQTGWTGAFSYHTRLRAARLVGLVGWDTAKQSACFKDLILVCIVLYLPAATLDWPRLAEIRPHTEQSANLTLHNTSLQYIMQYYRYR